MIIEDLKVFIETQTSLLMYPFHIPQGSDLPAIQYDQVNFSRHEDSNMSESNVTSHNFQLTIVTEDSDTCILKMDEIVNLLEGYSGVMGNSKVMICRVNNTVPLYNKQQQTYEYAIDVSMRINK